MRIRGMESVTYDCEEQRKGGAQRENAVHRMQFCSPRTGIVHYARRDSTDD